MDKPKRWVKNVIYNIIYLTQSWVKTTQQFLECTDQNKRSHLIFIIFDLLRLMMIIFSFVLYSQKVQNAVCSHPYGNIQIRPTFQINGK